MNHQHHQEPLEEGEALNQTVMLHDLQLPAGQRST